MKFWYIVMISTSLVLAACGKTERPFTEATTVSREPVYDPKVLDYAVLDVLEKALPGIDSDRPLTQAAGLCQLKLIADQREWIRTSISNTQLKAAYLNWLDFFDRQVHKRMNPEIFKKEDNDRKQIEAGQILAGILPVPPEQKEHCVK